MAIRKIATSSTRLYNVKQNDNSVYLPIGLVKFRHKYHHTIVILITLTL
jgi:hypothetical protein